MAYIDRLVDSYTLIVFIPFVIVWKRRQSLSLRSILGRLVTLMFAGLGVFLQVKMLESYTVLPNENAVQFSLDHRGVISYRYIVFILVSTIILFLIFRSIFDRQNKNIPSEF